MTVIEMQVHMDCAGCVNKINKALQKLKGVDHIDIDMSLQKVAVTGWVEQKKVLRKVRKTGRRAELWQPYAYNSEFGNPNCTALYYNHHYSGATTTCYTQQPSGSSYNYYKHGYDGSDRGYYHLLSHSTIFGNRPGDAFSDENPHGCSIM